MEVMGGACSVYSLGWWAFVWLAGRSSRVTLRQAQKRVMKHPTQLVLSRAGRWSRPPLKGHVQMKKLFWVKIAVS